jgi:hypothetical protein
MSSSQSIIKVVAHSRQSHAALTLAQPAHDLGFRKVLA